jgi:cyclohexanecarboxyl-CoA dehydrogenase
MEFDFTDEQRALASMVKSYGQQELQPNYAKWDREKIFPRHIWKKMGELGLIGMRISPEHGGQGADCITQGVATEEMAKYDHNMALAAFVVAEVCGGIMDYGNERVVEEFLKPMIEGDLVPAIAITEPHCGTDAAALKSRAVKKGDKYILSGEKSGTTMMKAADAVVLFAKTDPAAGARGVSAFMVPTGLPGVTRQYYEDLGSKPLVRGSIFMDEVELPEEYLIGKEGDGFRMIMHEFDASRIYLALCCIGAAEISLAETVQYTKERHAFNRPLAKFEGVSFPVAEHASIIEAVRLLCYKALWLRDQGLPHSKEAAMVKWMAPRYSVNAIRDCLLLHGHYGYTQEFPLEQRLRDVMGVEIADGTSQVSKIVITRELYGREYLPY